MSQSCLDCAWRSDRVFCDLEPSALKAFDGIKSFQSYAKGSVLFREGESAHSAFLMCQGRVRLTVCSESGRRMTIRTAPAGEVLGLSAVLSGGHYEVTAEAVEAVQAAEIHRKELLHFLRGHREVCLQVVNLLSEDLHVAYERVRAVGLTRTRHSQPHSSPAH
jgi:CRP/FNR family transcriptional regulator, cyclic AMP receptor protein